MSQLLTDEAEERAGRVYPWIIVGALCYVTYALAQHIGWRDSVAVVIVFWFTARSVRLAGRPP